MMRMIPKTGAGVVVGCALVAAGVQAWVQGAAPPLRAGEVHQGTLFACASARTVA